MPYARGVFHRQSYLFDALLHVLDTMTHGGSFCLLNIPVSQTGNRNTSLQNVIIFYETVIVFWTFWSDTTFLAKFFARSKMTTFFVFVQLCWDQLCSFALLIPGTSLSSLLNVWPKVMTLWIRWCKLWTAPHHLWPYENCVAWIGPNFTTIVLTSACVQLGRTSSPCYHF